jgi:hypothetical protein
LAVQRKAVSRAEELTQPFTMTEIEEALKQTKTITAPGPDFQCFSTRNSGLMLVKEMLDDMYNGQLNLGRLNLGLL